MSDTRTREEEQSLATYRGTEKIGSINVLKTPINIEKKYQINLTHKMLPNLIFI